MLFFNFLSDGKNIFYIDNETRDRIRKRELEHIEPDDFNDIAYFFFKDRSVAFQLLAF